MVFFVAAGTDQDTEVMMMVVVDHLQRGSIWFNHMSALKFKIVSGRQGKHTNVITEAGGSQVRSLDHQGPATISITWELVRDANSQALPQT